MHIFQFPKAEHLQTPLRVLPNGMLQLAYTGLIVQPQQLINAPKFDMATTATLINNVARIFASDAPGILVIVVHEYTCSMPYT